MNASALSPGLVLASAVIGSAMLAVVEWRRRDVRRRAARILASIAAVVALSFLALYKLCGEEAPPASPREAVLWTQNADASSAGSGPHFAVPGVTQAPPGTITVPDVSYIRRELPEIRKLRVLGEGLEPSELAALHGIEVVFDRPEQQPQKPTLSFLRFPREVATGERLHLEGRIDALPAGSTVAIAVIAPDGERTESMVSGRDGAPTNFAIAARAPSSEGRFIWRVSVVTSAAEIVLDETLGIVVVRPELPRVLVIESSPRLDTTHLTRWFGEIGGTIVSRAAVGQGRYRFTSSTETPVEFETIDRKLLETFDVLLLDAAAMSGLTPEERDAIKGAVAEEGLGVLALTGDGDAPAPRDESLFPWKIERAEDELPVGDELRTARLQWPGLAAPLEHPVALENVRIRLANTQSALVTDTQDRPVVATDRHWRGNLAVSTARDTWQWRLQANSETFATYWSYVFARVAKPADAQAQRWVIENSPTAPLAVNQPVQLRVAGAGEAPGEVHVTSTAEQGQVALALTNDPAEPQQWRGTFWPRRAGWHTVHLAPDGVRLDFFVHEPGAWASLAPARRAAATGRATSRLHPGADPSTAKDVEPMQSSAASVITLYALFLVSCGYLWLERRKAAA